MEKNLTLLLEKITKEFIDHIFIERYFIKVKTKRDSYSNSIIDAGETVFIEQLKTSIKRQKNRGFAKCMYENNSVGPDTEKCNAKVIRQLLKKSDFSKKRKPGDIFYVMDAVMGLLPGKLPKVVQIDKYKWNSKEIKPGMRCYLVKLPKKKLSTEITVLPE